MEEEEDGEGKEVGAAVGETEDVMGKRKRKRKRKKGNENGGG